MECKRNCKGQSIDWVVCPIHSGNPTTFVWLNMNLKFMFLKLIILFATSVFLTSEIIKKLPEFIKAHNSKNPRISSIYYR